MVRRASFVGLAAVFGLGAACAVSEKPSWRDQLIADSPCYRVDLLDGIDESSPDELFAVFDCVNRGHQLDSFVASRDALLGETRSGDLAAIELAHWLNHLPEVGVQPFGLFGIALDLLQSPDRPIREFLDVYLELAYGTDENRIRSGLVDLRSGDAIGRGVLAPLSPVVPVVAEALLDDDLQASHDVADLLAHPDTKRWIRTVGAYTGSGDPRVSEPVDGLLQHLGAAIAASRSPGNDRWLHADGDSLRDVVEVYAVGNNNLLRELSPNIDVLFSDAAVRSQLQAKIPVWYDDGRLERLPAQLQWMASVDVDGNSLEKGEVSGLHAFVRLLHDTNQPMQCGIDIGFTSLDVDLGNLAVTLLETIASLSPSLVGDGLGLIGAVLDFDLSRSLMEDIADSGVCPAFTPEVANDLQAVDLMYNDRASDVLVVFIDTINVLDSRGQIDVLADLATDAYDGGGVDPIEELIRDIGDEPLMADVVNLIPVLLEPARFDIEAGDEPAVDLDDVLDLAAWAFAEGDNGQTGLERWQPLLTALLDENGTWEAMGNASVVLTTDGNQTAKLFELIPPLLAVDPELETLDSLATILGDDEVAGPALRIAETQGVADELMSSTPPEDQEVPIGFIGRLVVDGTVDELLATIDVLVGAFSN